LFRATVDCPLPLSPVSALPPSWSCHRAYPPTKIFFPSTIINPAAGSIHTSAIADDAFINRNMSSW
jgi:hypothetical protein